MATSNRHNSAKNHQITLKFGTLLPHIVKITLAKFQLNLKIIVYFTDQNRKISGKNNGFSKKMKVIYFFTDPLGPANWMKTISISSIGSSVTFWKFL